MGHSIDFHAGDIAPDAPMRTIAPGESLQYRFTAKRAGIWMYHCSTMPMSAHIAAGMHGAVEMCIRDSRQPRQPRPTPPSRAAAERVRPMTAPNPRSWPLRDRTSLLWLALAAVIALVHRYVPDARWLMVHLVVLGALTHAILVWSTHFTQALLKTPADLDGRGAQSRRLVLLIGGVMAVLAGVPFGLWLSLIHI